MRQVLSPRSPALQLAHCSRRSAPQPLLVDRRSSYPCFLHWTLYNKCLRGRGDNPHASTWFLNSALSDCCCTGMLRLARWLVCLQVIFDRGRRTLPPGQLPLRPENSRPVPTRNDGGSSLRRLTSLLGRVLKTKAPGETGATATPSTGRIVDLTAGPDQTRSQPSSTSQAEERRG